MRNRLFALLPIVLFLLGIGIFLMPQKDVSVMEKRNLTTNSDIAPESLISGNFISDTESVLKDQFFLRDTITQQYYRFKILLNRPFTGGSRETLTDVTYTFLDDDVIEINDGYLMNNVLIYDEEKAKLASGHGYNINAMDKQYPGVKTYVYFPTRIEEILDVGYDLNYGLNYRRNFIIELNENITYDSLKINSIIDYQHYYFKSDNHWNAKGAYTGYNDIINMIKKDFKIDEPRRINKEITYDYEFHGNISSQIGQLGESDHISDYELEGVGEYKLYVNGEPFNLNEVKEKYRLYGNNTQYSDYDYYFGDNYYERVFYFNQNDKPNILIFGDSFMNAIQEWVASHFNKTVLIDLRAKDDSFSLDNYIEKYDIDIILVMLPYKDLYFNGNMFVPLD